jgi:hypothetical protein
MSYAANSAVGDLRKQARFYLAYASRAEAVARRRRPFEIVVTAQSR